MVVGEGLIVGDATGDGACVKQCQGKTCGDDGCGGTCPPGCPGGQICAKGQCLGAMVRIPAAGKTTTFTMGRPSSDGWGLPFEQPSHSVTLDAYEIDRHETTVAEYKACVSAGGCKAPKPADHALGNWGAKGRENHPINVVTWDRAQAYCTWAKKRLPTEAEWERAAKGPKHRRYPWGDACPKSWSSTYCKDAEWKPSTAKANVSTNYADDGYQRTAPVGSFAAGASPEGVMDMAGNVGEWVADWFSKAYYAKSPSTNPKGPSSGTLRVVRGGTYASGGGSYVRALYRDGYVPSYYGAIHGFRCARSIP
jgi:eukaryotic-like serine/threonine-protein kinase